VERFKALAGTSQRGLFGFASGDGLRWHKLRETPLITKGAFDSPGRTLDPPLRQSGRRQWNFRRGHLELRSVQEMELDLSALPNSDGSTTNLLAVLRTEHSLDILVQANTAVIICNVARTSLRALLTQVGSR